MQGMKFRVQVYGDVWRLPWSLLFRADLRSHVLVGTDQKIRGRLLSSAFQLTAQNSHQEIQIYSNLLLTVTYHMEIEEK